MAGQTKLDYEQMQAIAKQYQLDQNDISMLMQQTKTKLDGLHALWVGDAADKFFSQMDTTLMPKLSNLVNVLGKGADVTTKIAQTIQQADEETKGFFATITK